ncbi:GNAT family N-acetyltransferase [Massilia glaciei]|uniref:N-acetyltransferase n=1 Tax=Massilia glaciei TaxID=1524097 RepID=A0A2U2HHB6_9BURK|nr:GNAT family N-acetyltransferase [Massilia glaciei]PWF45070.1 N-acetyltransferase [Massilia glaciei]
MLTRLLRGPLGRWFGLSGDARLRPGVRVKELRERDRGRMHRHFLALEPGDRLLRFGTVLPDAMLGNYVARIDFSNDNVFGVYNGLFKLVAVGHLAFAPKQPGAAPATDKAQVAEFGVSVSRSARGMGIGSKLFERAAIHCRNCDVDTLYMHCLSSNKVMMHIAAKAGMAIERDHGEADAYLRLPPPDPSSMLQEALDEQFASFDYALKANKRFAHKWFGARK